MSTSIQSPSTSARLLTAAVAVLAVTPLLRRLIARYAVPTGTPWRSSCDACGTRWEWLSGVGSPSGRCATCGTGVGAPPVTVEVALLATVAALLTADLRPFEVAAIMWWAGCWIALAHIDWQVHRLPDPLTAAAAAGCQTLLAVGAWWHDDWSAWWRALAAGAICALLFASTLLLGARGFGLGDVKGAVSAGSVLGWFGWPVLLVGMCLSVIVAAVYGLALLVTGRPRTTQIPFGPFLAVGTLAGVLLSA